MQHSVSAREPWRTTGKICAKSPPNTHGIPPDGTVCESDPLKSHRVVWTARQKRCCIGTSSQIISEVVLCLRIFWVGKEPAKEIGKLFQCGRSIAPLAQQLWVMSRSPRSRRQNSAAQVSHSSVMAPKSLDSY